MSQITIGYWDIRGLGESIRFLLHYKKVKFVDKRYTFDSGEWPKDKFNLGLHFPNLPYLFDGDLKLTQSITILRYLAKKYDLDGGTEVEKVKVSMVEQQVVDLRWLLFNAIMEPDLEKARTEFVVKAQAPLKLFKTFLGDRDFLVGAGVTYADFMASETFDFFRYFVPELLRNFPTLKAHQERVVSMPELQEYLNSSTYKRWPVFSPMAGFGGSGEEPSRD